MPRSSPFTALCQTAARPLRTDRADLHVHSTASDGLYTPTEVIGLARRCGLAALALTDHDTLAGFAEARIAAGASLEIIAAVEITAGHEGREVHLLAYFVDPTSAPLLAALERLRAGRVTRFHAMFDSLVAAGLPLRPEDIPTSPRDTLGRPHLARLIVQAGRASTTREAIQRYLLDNSPHAVAKPRLPVAEAVALVRAAGGVLSLAHPSHHTTRESLVEFRRLGVAAVEVEYPDFKGSRVRQLRQWASELGLAITGGSDCHGPGKRAVGSHSIARAELEALRERCEGG
jgi:predicted metal-dependent phosphoesterase TrpH